MRGVYTATYKISALAAARTLMYIQPASGAVAELLYASVTNASNATNQQIECSLTMVTSLGTPTATSVTPSPHEPSDQAAGSTVKANVTASEPTYTGAVSVNDEGAPSLSGWFWEPAANRTAIATNAKPWGIRMISTPTAFDCLVNLTFREIG